MPGIGPHRDLVPVAVEQERDGVQRRGAEVVGDELVVAAALAVGQIHEGDMVLELEHALDVLDLIPVRLADPVESVGPVGVVGHVVEREAGHQIGDELLGVHGIRAALEQAREGGRQLHQLDGDLR